MAWPAHDERNGTACLKRAVLASAERTARTMVASQFYGVVVVAVIEHGPIVGGQDHKRIVLNAFLAEHGDDFTHRPVELHNGIAT